MPLILRIIDYNKISEGFITKSPFERKQCKPKLHYLASEDFSAFLISIVS